MVEEIGLRSTKVRTFSKSLISVPNADIASAPIENFSQMTSRRIKAIIGLVYATSPDQIVFVIEGIKRLIHEDDCMDHTSYYVNLVEFGPSSLDIMIYCSTKTTVWGEYMDVRQRFYLDVMRLVAGVGTQMAYPSQSLYVETPVGRFGEPAPGCPPTIETPEHVRAFARAHEAAGDDASDDHHSPSLGETGDGMSSG